MERRETEGLLDRLNRGDEQAAEQVFRAYEPFLRRVVRRRLPAEAQARFESWDIVQSIWADLWTGFRGGSWYFADEAHLRAFLVRVAQCRLYDRARKALTQAKREQPLALLPAEPPTADPRPSECAQADAVWQRLLELCPQEHHPILHLRRAGLTLVEIASRTGLHEGSVRRVLRRLAREAAFGRAEKET